MTIIEKDPFPHPADLIFTPTPDPSTEWMFDQSKSGFALFTPSQLTNPINPKSFDAYCSSLDAYYASLHAYYSLDAYYARAIHYECKVLQGKGQLKKYRTDDRAVQYGPAGYPLAKTAPEMRPLLADNRHGRRSGTGSRQSSEGHVQPEIRPIPQEERNFHARLLWYKAPCMEVDIWQSAQNESSPKLNNGQQQRLLSLHRTLQQDYSVEPVEASETEFSFPANCSSGRRLRTDDLYTGGWSDSDPFKAKRTPQHLLFLRGTHGRVTWRGSGDEQSTSSGIYFDPLDALHNISHANNLFNPGYHLIHLSLLSTIPRRFLWLATLTAMAIPVNSANVGILEWGFGGMASVPSIYVLANPPVSSSMANGAEEVAWKIARGWGLTFGLVFAALFVRCLSTKYHPEKRMYFVAVVFASILALMLLLMHFMVDDTWNVLDLLAPCVCFCATATYIIISESRRGDTVGENRDEEEGGIPLQENPARNQPDQPLQISGGAQPEGEVDDTSVDVQPPIQEDDAFTIDDDRTLGDEESRTSARQG